MQAKRRLAHLKLPAANITDLLDESLVSSDNRGMSIICGIAMLLLTAFGWGSTALAQAIRWSQRDTKIKLTCHDG